MMEISLKGISPLLKQSSHNRLYPLCGLRPLITKRVPQQADYIKFRLTEKDALRGLFERLISGLKPQLA